MGALSKSVEIIYVNLQNTHSVPFLHTLPVDKPVESVENFGISTYISSVTPLYPPCEEHLSTASRGFRNPNATVLRKQKYKITLSCFLAKKFTKVFCVSLFAGRTFSCPKFFCEKPPKFFRVSSPAKWKYWYYHFS